jgi:hypothetical protein
MVRTVRMVERPPVNLLGCQETVRKPSAEGAFWGISVPVNASCFLTGI